MTAHSMVGEKEKCMGIGMNEYITKPFKQEELLKKITQLVKIKLEEGNNLVPIDQDSIVEPIDLSYLKELCENNHEFEKEMIELFLQQVPSDIDLLNKAIDSIHFENIGSLAHKLKSSVIIIGLKSTSEALSSIESGANDNKDISQIRIYFEKVSKRLESSYKELNLILSGEYK